MARRSTPGKLKGIDVMAELRKHGNNVKETAQALDVSAKTIHDWKKANNIVVVRTYEQAQS